MLVNKIANTSSMGLIRKTHVLYTMLVVLCCTHFLHLLCHMITIRYLLTTSLKRLVHLNLENKRTCVSYWQLPCFIQKVGSEGLRFILWTKFRTSYEAGQGWTHDPWICHSYPLNCIRPDQTQVGYMLGEHKLRDKHLIFAYILVYSISTNIRR